MRPIDDCFPTLRRRALAPRSFSRESCSREGIGVSRRRSRFGGPPWMRRALSSPSRVARASLPSDGRASDTPVAPARPRRPACARRVSDGRRRAVRTRPRERSRLPRPGVPSLARRTHACSPWASSPRRGGRGPLCRSRDFAAAVRLARVDSLRRAPPLGRSAPQLDPRPRPSSFSWVGGWASASLDRDGDERLLQRCPARFRARASLRTRNEADARAHPQSDRSSRGDPAVRQWSAAAAFSGHPERRLRATSSHRGESESASKGAPLARAPRSTEVEGST